MSRPVSPRGRGGRWARGAAWAAALLALPACSDRNVLLPSQLPAPQSLPAATCTVDVKAKRVACTDAQTASTGGARADKYVGGQEKYVRLTSSNVAYDNVDFVFTFDETVQNLLKQKMGTTDGSTLTPIKVFFSQEPTATSGTGEISILNADGIGMFTATNQPYYQYDEILAPYQISGAKTWEFSVPSTVSTFVFTVYVAAPLADENTSLLDRVWTGVTSTVWSLGSNWAGGVAPDSAATVAIPADSLLAPGHSLPALDAATAVTHLRVGYGSTLGLNGFTLTAWGNVDAPGAVSGSGSLRVAGSSALIGGTFSALSVSGTAQLQRAVTATAVSVNDGHLTVNQPLLINAP